MKKQNLAKLVLKGVATGALLASQAVVAHDTNADSTHLAFGACGGGCQGKKNAAGTTNSSATSKLADEDLNKQIYTDEDEEQSKRRKNATTQPPQPVQPSYRNTNRGSCAHYNM